MLFVLLVLLVGALTVLVVMVLLVLPSFTICGWSEVPLCEDFINKYTLSIVVCVYTISELITLSYNCKSLTEVLS